MTLPNQIFDIYIDLNITFAITAVVWLVAKLVLERLGIKLAYSVQLGLLNGLFVITALSPGAVALYSHLLDAGVVPGTLSVNLSDMVVSQYLRGGIAIPAQDFQSLLGLRGQLSSEILSVTSVLGAGIVSVFLAGVTFFGLKLANGFIQLNRALASCHVWRDHGRLRLLLSDTAVVPYSARGLIRNYVVLPSELLTQSEDLKLVLKHEFEHLRQGDVTWEIGLELLRPLFFWNPFFYIWKSEVERLRELACDQKVAENAQVDLKSYCMCLLRAAKSRNSKTRSLFEPKPIQRCSCRADRGAGPLASALAIPKAPQPCRSVDGTRPCQAACRAGGHGDCSDGSGGVPHRAGHPKACGLEPGSLDAVSDHQSGAS
jgi:beta-lactamase regulating signal transducer with metallopeptidase domain